MIVASFRTEYPHKVFSWVNNLISSQMHFLSGWLPFPSLPLHNWAIGRNAYNIKSNFLEKTVVDVFLHSDEKEMRHSQCYHANMQGTPDETSNFFNFFLLETERAISEKCLKLLVHTSQSIKKRKEWEC